MKLFRRSRRPSTFLEVRSLAGMRAFFTELGWTDDGASVSEAWFDTPGGRFGLRQAVDIATTPRVELALAVPTALHVEEIAAFVEVAGGIITEPVQETAYGGWGFTFNDPEGNNWEIGAPTTVTHEDHRLGGRITGRFDGPLVALVVRPTAARRAE